MRHLEVGSNGVSGALGEGVLVVDPASVHRRHVHAPVAQVLRTRPRHHVQRGLSPGIGAVHDNGIVDGNTRQDWK